VSDGAWPQAGAPLGFRGDAWRQAIAQPWLDRGDTRGQALHTKAARHRNRRQIGAVDNTRVHAELRVQPHRLGLHRIGPVGRRCSGDDQAANPIPWKPRLGSQALQPVEGAKRIRG
jgi:hypothetical protein